MYVREQKNLIRKSVAKIWGNNSTSKRTIFAEQKYPHSPEEAIELLSQGNARFSSGHNMALGRSLERVSSLQPPFASVLACSDLRVPIEVIFDQAFGDLFIVRLAGNFITPETLASLELSCLTHGSKVVYVLGHSPCNVMIKSQYGVTPSNSTIASIFNRTSLAWKDTADIEKATIKNVVFQLKELQKCPSLIQLIMKKKLLIAGGIFNVQSRKITRVECDEALC
jgi:carbonic anhydrase